MKLRSYLKEKSITAYALSKKTDVSQSTISEFMSGKRVIKFDTACKLANALEITLDEFEKLTEEGEDEDI
ncbi:helix-turn-helix transcriptional regulator [uncultured Clostridium sp.]|uniref:helix-turn-helix domain-containing protein n=1 Tax=uncultured Clostridium sp. TaxID=59620 RepID=UPI0025E6EFEE|nr:helix-turn-helix transcriptional regulator [uncultured Clostridium sp.]